MMNAAGADPDRGKEMPLTPTLSRREREKLV